jgi:hypothetical protein
MARRITLICSGGKYLEEVRMALPLNFRADGSIEQLAGTGTASEPQTSKCGSDQIYIERSGPN